MTGSRAGLILDRDGVINVDTGFVHRIEDCRFVPGIFELLRAARARDFAIAVATNQSGIGRGYFSEADFHRLMEEIGHVVAARAGTVFDAVYFCPDHPTEGIGAYRRESPMRKPHPGMMRQAIADLGLDPARSWAVGDRLRDLEAAAGAGIANLVLFDEAAGGVARHGDHWVVPRLADIPALFDGRGVLPEQDLA